MPNKTKKLLTTTIFLTILLFSSFYAILTPTAHAAEMTTQQKGLTICGDVLGIDMTKVNVTTKEFPTNSQSTFLGVIPQETIIYELTSGKNKLSLLNTFANGNLQMLQVLDDGIKTSNKEAALPNATYFNVLGAKAFLTNYQSYAGDSLYNNLKSTLNNINPKTNQTITSGSLQLEVISFPDGGTNFKWYYTANGATSPYSKFISLGFSNGRFNAFVNNWQFYNIGNTEINVSKEKAIAIALDAAKAYAFNMNVDASGFQSENINESNIKWSSLIFDNSLGVDKVRNDDQLALYPDWRIGVTFDKWYGEMYGLEIDVWADTGQIRTVQEAYSPIREQNASETNITSKSVASSYLNQNTLLATISFITLTVLATTTIWVVQKKRSNVTIVTKFPSKKTFYALFCILLTLSLLLASVGTVSATTRGAVVWGSESDAARNLPPPYGDGLQWRKSQTEISDQQYTAMYAAYYFSQNGYSGNPDIYNIDHQGAQSTQTGIPADITYLQNYYDYTAVVDFDHGVGGYAGLGGYGAPASELHYMFEDNDGTITGTRADYEADPAGHTNWVDGVYDMEIYPLVTADKVIFAFINTCLSANTVAFGPSGGGMVGPDTWPARAMGMPYAWMHRTVQSSSNQGFTITEDISNDGYLSPDWGYQVYIGFPYGSASLSQPLPYNGGGYPYYYWVVTFLYYALTTDISVNEALNAASNMWLGWSAFSYSPLQTGFTAHWDGFDDQPDSTMAVYGNGNIHLKNFVPPSDVATVRSLNGPTTGTSNNQCGPFSAFATNPYGNDVIYRFDWGDGSQYEPTNSYSDGQPATGKYHVYTAGGFYHVRVSAKTANSDWGDWSNPIIVNIDNQPNPWLTVDAYDTYYSGWINPYVSIEGVTSGYAPISVQVFPGYYSVTMDQYYGMLYLPWYSGLTDGTNYYNNGDYIQVYADTEVTGLYTLGG